MLVSVGPYVVRTKNHVSSACLQERPAVSLCQYRSCLFEVLLQLSGIDLQSICSWVFQKTARQTVALDSLSLDNSCIFECSPTPSPKGKARIIDHGQSCEPSPILALAISSLISNLVAIVGFVCQFSGSDLLTATGNECQLCPNHLANPLLRVRTFPIHIEVDTYAHGDEGN